MVCGAVPSNPSNGHLRLRLQLKIEKRIAETVKLLAVVKPADLCGRWIGIAL